MSARLEAMRAGHLAAAADYARPQSVRDADVLREQLAAEERVLREGYLIDTDDSAAVAEIVDAIESAPHVLAARLLRLDREVGELRLRVGAVEHARAGT